MLTGWTLEQAAGQPLENVFVVFNKISDSKMDNPYEQVRKTGLAYGLDINTILVARDGTHKPIWGNCAPVNDQHQQFSGVVLAFRDITGQQWAQNALDQNRQELDAVFENNPIAMMLLNEKRQIFKANRAARQFMGKSTEELFNLRPGSPLNCINAFDDERGCGYGPQCQDCKLRHMVQDSFERSVVHHRVEISMPTVNMAQPDLFLVVSTTPITIHNQKFVLVSLDDITQHKKMEDELRDAELRYKTVANFAYDWEYWETPEGDFLYVSPSCQRITGYTADQFEKDHKLLGNIIYEPDSDIWNNHHHDIVESSNLREIQFRIKRKDGEIRWIEHACQPILGAQDNLLGYRASNRDITERKQALEALRQSEKQYRQIFESVSDALIIYDAKGTIVEANPAACQMYGYTYEEMIGLTGKELILPDKYYLFEQFKENLQAGRDFFVESVDKRKDGTSFDIQIKGKAFDLKRSLHFMSVLRDITDIKQHRREREKLYQTIEEKNKELETIINVTSHDLRTPLVNIHGFSRELDLCCQKVHNVLDKYPLPVQAWEDLEGVFQDDVPQALHYIKVSAEKMDTLLTGLLQLSRLGRKELHIENLDMEKLLSLVVKSMEFQIKESSTQMEIDSLPACQGDSDQINQVFTNLLDNSLKYLHPDRTGTIRVSGHTQDDRSIYCVEDNGIGIDMRHKDKIFELFHRINPGNNLGEGLGLSIVRRIMDRHDGKIWIESQAGSGTKFYVSLPT